MCLEKNVIQQVTNKHNGHWYLCTWTLNDLLHEADSCEIGGNFKLVRTY